MHACDICKVGAIFMRQILSLLFLLFLLVCMLTETFKLLQFIFAEGVAVLLISGLNMVGTEKLENGHPLLEPWFHSGRAAFQVLQPLCFQAGHFCWVVLGVILGSSASILLTSNHLTITNYIRYLFGSTSSSRF